VIVVRMVQVAINEIIDMVAVRHRLVATIGVVPVRTFVTAAVVIRRATMRGFHLQPETANADLRTLRRMLMRGTLVTD
jgi:hypothetical protein